MINDETTIINIINDMHAEHTVLNELKHHKDKGNYVFWDFGCYEFLKLGEDEIPVISAEEGNNIIAEIDRILENPPDDERIIILDSLGSSINVKQV